MTDKPKAVIMVSGGPDSAALLHSEREKFNLKAIFFNYGQEAADYELRAARSICDKAEVPLEVIDISGVKNSFLGLGGSDRISFSLGLCNCPIALFGIAATYSLGKGANKLLVAIHGEDFPRVKNLGEQIKMFSMVITELNGQKFDIITPFIEKSKSDVFMIGARLGVPFELTRSCAKTGEFQCGECYECKARKNAFLKSKATDSTKYNI